MNMQYRNLGNSGVKVSEIGLGAAGFGHRVDKDTVRRIVDTALDHGINLIDTADIYGGGLSEEYLGPALEGHRDEVVIATKGRQRTGDGPNDIGASRYHLMNALEASLRRLRTDHVDLYQIHIIDESTPLEETMRTLDDMVRSGKVRYIGASNYAAWQMCRCNDIAEAHGWEKFITVQPHYHMLEREIERELVPYCRAFRIGILPYFPLAAGMLAGRYSPEGAQPPGSRAEAYDWVREYMDGYAADGGLETVDKLTAWAAERDHTLLELSFAWLLAEPLVSSVIAGVTKVEYVAPNVRAAEWVLTADEMGEVRAILERP
jgi:aryl-alcohol dehydrogenase-like predicted oxidoreductase